MTRETFAQRFAKIYTKSVLRETNCSSTASLSRGKVNNYCRYAFAVFDSDGTGVLNFSEYVRALHIHQSDDLEESLALVRIGTANRREGCAATVLFLNRHLMLSIMTSPKA